MTPCYIDHYFAEKMGARDENEKTFLSALMKVSREGDLCLDLTRCDEKVVLGAQTFSSPYIHRFENFCYLKRNWVYETRVIKHVSRLLREAASINYNSSELASEQQKAVSSALSHYLSIITGGPGTGKTFIARHLIQAVVQEKGEDKARLILAAPTGKAAMRLQEKNPDILCGTLHALLGIRSERDFVREGSYLNADLIVVDECSMIDIRLFSYFLASIPKGVRVVLMGDCDQLPPIESGNLFADLIDLVPTAKLTISLRSDKKEILNLATAIRNGLWNGEILPLEAIWKEISSQSWDKMRILSCVREGPWGVNTVNRQIFDHLKRREEPVPILITRTDYNLGLYNGETGYLKGQRAFFSEGKEFPITLLPPYEKAYCLSVHKSQGSEFDSIFLLVPPGSEVFGREMLYTAVTRACSTIKVFSNSETIQKTLQRVGRKISGIRARLKI